jgi:hypothetical protein
MFEHPNVGPFLRITYDCFLTITYNLHIKNHDAPLFEASMREKNKGSKEAVTRIIQLIPELCQRTGQTDELRSRFPQTAQSPIKRKTINPDPTPSLNGVFRSLQGFGREGHRSVR